MAIWVVTSLSPLKGLLSTEREYNHTRCCPGTDRDKGRQWISSKVFPHNPPMATNHKKQWLPWSNFPIYSTYWTGGKYPVYSTAGNFAILPQFLALCIAIHINPHTLFILSFTVSGLSMGIGRQLPVTANLIALLTRFRRSTATPVCLPWALAEEGML